MGWLGEPLPSDQQAGATPFVPRYGKDLIEEALFARRRNLFSGLDLVFFDTTSLDALEKITVAGAGKSFVIRGQTLGDAGRALQAVGVALGPTMHLAE